ncbi:MMPL family transporter [Salibacterium halotolerans]|uniref:Putative drug exporter of the RND superfamily n=1 Tax=Salibacterium halotolerans TaxID=1884432 RepID=A0A1I5L6U9_9BACI|nr:MMPL family transporter [Salibacterium halotolerans]SFO92928.1 putative drug exporter of the RND superfamily [Salibacterium halotolerans]
MRTILRFRWVIAAALAALTALLFFLSPDLSRLSEQEDSFQLPNEMTSQQADQILEKAGEGAESISLVLELDGSLTEEKEQNITEYMEDVRSADENIEEVTSPFEREEIRNQLVSSEENVVLVPVSVDGGQEAAVQAGEAVQSLSVPDGMTQYVTGDAIISDAVDETTQEGLERTEGITVVLIFALLLIVFRAVVTPFIPLIAVGVTYLLSQSVIALLAESFGFPLSTYTQVFLVAVLFGIGTDYCILLLSRYKEELSDGHEVKDAIVNTYRSAGKTLLYSGVAVLVGFSAIGFADFAIFQSAVGVAVGIIVLLLVLYTLMPFFMAVLKDKLFWPSKKGAAHQDNKLWKAMGRLSVFRPILSILIVAVVTVPFLLTYDNNISYNNTDEIGSGAQSVEGLNVIESAFGMGDALPLEIVIDSDDDMITKEKLAAVESLARTLNRSDAVDEVRGVTRPTGSVLDSMYVDNQLQDVSTGISDARDGLTEVQNGLSDVQSGLQNMNSRIQESGSGSTGSLNQAASSIETINSRVAGISSQLQQTGNTQEAIQQLSGVQQGLTEVQNGMQQGTQQLSNEQQARANDLASSLDQLTSGVQDAINGLQDINSGLESAETYTREASDASYVRGSGVFVPDDLLENEDFQEGVDQYAFEDRTGMTMEVSLKQDPYSVEAIEAVENVKELVSMETAGTPLEQDTITYSGVPGTNADLENISSEDFTNTIIIILIGLFLILAVLLRSIVQPAFILGGLLLAYYTAMGAAEMIFVQVLDYPGMMWPVPFFGFVMLVALGVDYSIFLFDRYREEAELGVREGLLKAMKKMGTVIITAAIILSGTFGAMIPSGVLTLMQVGTVVVTGLLLFGLVILPLFIPAVVRLHDSPGSLSKQEDK